MIIQTAPAGSPRLAIMMYEHTALCGQFARAFGNDDFEPLAPLDPMVYVVSHHDAGWTEFDRDPVTDEKTGLPYNLIETPAEYITVTSRQSPDFNERQHPFCGLISSMHSWGLYNGRYGLSDHVLIKKFPEKERPLAERMLDGELRATAAAEGGDRQKIPAVRLARREEIVPKLQAAAIPRYARALFQSRPPRASAARRRSSTCRAALTEDTTVTIRPQEPGVYALSPFPFAPDGAEFAFAGRRITSREHERSTAAGLRC
jgi:hypothetical protein